MSRFHTLRQMLFATMALLPLAARAADPAASASPPPDAATLRHWVEQMKTTPRGPFKRIRWFCRDGTILPPGENACRNHGGGIQHGEWSDHTLALWSAGYAIGNVLADLKPARFTGATADLTLLKDVLLERFLISADDGWIYRHARFYRGALQVEDERSASRRLLRAFLADPSWRTGPRFLLLREAARLLPIQTDTPLVTAVRNLATEINTKDPDFQPLRTKLHGMPDATDADAVRAYAAAHGRPELADAYARLATDLDTLYAPQGAAEVLRTLAAQEGDPHLARWLRDRAAALEAATEPENHFALVCELLRRLRARILGPWHDSALTRFRLMEASLLLEQDAFATGNRLLAQLPEASRRTRLQWLQHTAAGLYGTGLLSPRQRSAVEVTIKRLTRHEQTSVGDYYDALRYLGRIPQWSQRAMAFHFGRAVDHLAAIEPRTRQFIPDRLRSSLLLFYSRVLDSLTRDATRLAGIQQRLFGHDVGSGLRALNPGLARGALHIPAHPRDTAGYRRDGIYVLPSTLPDLPPVAGILTRGEGSSLSHVQLLARNLGIPNVVVNDDLLPELTPHAGQRVVLAVSPGGVVQLARDDAHWDAVFGPHNTEPTAGTLRANLQKLDLGFRRIVPLADLRADDSGRIAGPKAANLGELKHYYGAAVPEGVVIPFGAFRELLNQPLEPGGPKVIDWMRRNYADIRALAHDPAEQRKKTGVFLARLRHWIEHADPGEDFRRRLHRAMERSFGADGSYGVFVRSDTNMEDLPGFTGAGLNLTVPNVVGFAHVLAAIGRVWASPFTERAYAWRQARMADPEQVYPAVLLLRSFPSDKSGVMVTTDVDTDDRGWISVAVNEGIGGAVAGQAAEELRIRLRDGRVRLMAQATAPVRLELNPHGGLRRVPASGTDRVLQPAEIQQLLAVARNVDRHFPLPRDDRGRPVPADIEFAFHDGHLALFQIRPYAESRRARRNQALVAMDAELSTAADKPVSLEAVPPTGPAQ